MQLALFSLLQYLKHIASVSFYFWYIPYLYDLFQIFYFCLNFFPHFCMCDLSLSVPGMLIFSPIPTAHFCPIHSSLHYFLILFMNSTIRKHLSYFLPSSFFYLERGRHFFHRSSCSLCIFICYSYWFCSIVVLFLF